MLVILDASVLVSAILVQHPEAAPFRTLDAILRSGTSIVVSAALADEWNDVLRRPNTLRRAALEAADVEQLLNALISQALIVDAVPARVEAPDRTDQHLWDLLDSVADSILVTRDTRLLESRHFPGRILSPRDFVDRFLA